MNELKPCPCGCDAKLVYESGESYGLHNGVKYTSVKCSSCSFRANDTDDWNTRADGWISVDDELPKEDSEVIACCGDDVKSCVFRLYYNGDYDFEVVDGSEFIFAATHWMPLPAPPKAVK